MSARAALRAATAGAHDEVDSIFSRFDLGRTEGYRRFLMAQASAVLPVEAALDRAGAAELVPDWTARRRADALRSDLSALSAEPPPPLLSPIFGSPEAVLGGVYVLEGSRLGGALLSRSLPAGVPSAFLGSPPDSPRWRKLLEDLERLLYRHDQVAKAAGAAINVFACFAIAGRRELENAGT